MRCRKIIERLPILQRSRHCVCVHGKNCWMVPSAHCGLLKSLPETMSRNLQKFDLKDRRQIVLANPFLSLLLIKEMLVLSCAKHRRSSSLHSHSPSFPCGSVLIVQYKGRGGNGSWSSSTKPAEEEGGFKRPSPLTTPLEERRGEGEREEEI